MQKISFSILILLTILNFPACNQGTLSVSGMRLRAAPVTQPATVAFLEISNGTNKAEYLLGVSSDAVERAELHTMELNAGIMKMRPVEKLSIPVGATLKLESGSTHIMLIGLQKEFIAGENHNITLHFANMGDMVIPFPIKAE